MLQACAIRNKPSDTMSREDKSHYESHSPLDLCGFEGFTESAAEHIIDEIRQPFIVCRIKGKITNDEGVWPENLPILFEIRRTGKDSKTAQALADGNGTFEMPQMAEGRYCFKATVLGWRSVMGIIIVDKKADPKRTILINMLFGV